MKKPNSNFQKQWFASRFVKLCKSRVETRGRKGKSITRMVRFIKIKKNTRISNAVIIPSSIFLFPYPIVRGRTSHNTNWVTSNKKDVGRSRSGRPRFSYSVCGCLCVRTNCSLSTGNTLLERYWGLLPNTNEVDTDCRTCTLWIFITMYLQHGRNVETWAFNKLCTLFELCWYRRSYVDL